MPLTISLNAYNLDPVYRLSVKQDAAVFEKIVVDLDNTV